MNAPQYVDISVFNPPQIDWQAYKAWSASSDGISHVAIRSSYGTGYTDGHFEEYRQGALAAGIDVIIFYHYAYPELNAPQAEADWQHQVVGPIREHDLLMLDYEEGDAHATASWACDWLARQEQNYGKPPLLYAYDAYIRERLQDNRLAHFPLVLADWQYNPNERPPCPPPWQSYAFLQWSDKASNIPGISGLVDADEVIPQPPQPPTPPKENPPMITITASTPGVADYFKEIDGQHWVCIAQGPANGMIIRFAILDFYKSFMGSDLCGLTWLGLPLSDEIPLDGNGAVIQHYERADVIYDPQHAHDNPPGSGPIYLGHIDRTLQQKVNAARQNILASAKIAGDMASHILDTMNGLAS